MKEELWDIWESGQFVGNTKPVTRAIIQKATVQEHGTYRSLIFGQTQPWYEIPNIKTVQIDQRHQSEAASMTLTFLNQVPIDPLANLDLDAAGTTAGPSVREMKDLAQPGYYTFRRGITPESIPRFGHGVDPIWVDMFIPNRLIRTFQGYGSNEEVQAWEDENLVMTGTWLIDKVEYSADGDIVLQCRDLAKLLIEQRLYPPIVPLMHYPLEFCADYIESTTETFTTTTGTTTAAITGANVASKIASGWDSSVAPWYGHNGAVYGHRASHAFDGNNASYWLSVGNSGPNQVWSYEWIGANTKGEPVNQVYFKPKWGGYVCYVAVLEGGVWQGSSTVPYGYNSGPAKPNGSNKKYVKKVTIPKSEAWVTIDLPRTYNAQQVWLIFTNLAHSGLGTYPYRAAVYEMQVRHYTPATDTTVTTEEIKEVEYLVQGNITDYTDIVKVLAAWSGFYWPYGAPTDPLLDGWKNSIFGADTLQFPTGNDPVIGRVWGDFAYSGAYPVEPPCIPASFWDNKSVMDGINQLKEILGFICYIDATGGIVWRMPNIWKTGNFITGYGFIGDDSVRNIDETKVLIDYGVTIDDNNLRSEIIVVSADDPTLHTAIQPGFAQGEVVPSAVDPQGDLALLGGQQRIMLVPNYPFISQEEVDKFAYLTSLWIHWSYRKGKFRIPGNPAFEPDDQVRIYERVTEESYVHYIQGVRSIMDLDKGTWYLDVDTHWLGNGPDDTWVVNTYADMPPALFAYLVAIGAINTDGEEGTLPPGFDPDFVIPDFEDEVPRLDEDLEQLFPDPPEILYPYDDSWSDEDIANQGDGWVTSPGPAGGGSVNSRSEAWRYQFWGARGSDLTTITFMHKWQSVYGSLPPSEVPKWTHVNQASTVKTTVPKATAAAYLLLAQLLAAQNYNVFKGDAFAGVDRKIANTNTYSAHAWGLAIDINPKFDGTYNDCCSTAWSSWLARPHSAAFYAAAQQITDRIRTKSSNTRVFGWGGYWKTKKDYMHFEVVATRAQCLEGVYLS